MTLWKQFIVMACVIAALLIWDRQLAANRRDSESRSGSIAAFVPSDVFADRPVAAVKYETAGSAFLFAFQEGLWRCIGFNDAPAIETRVSALTPALLVARGVVVSRNPEGAGSYGFGSDTTIHLSFCGQYVLQDRGGDKILEIEVGNTIPGTGGCFVRKVDSNEVWAINIDFHSIIGQSNRGNIPPMVDTRLVPESWNGFREGVNAITIQPTGESPITCRLSLPSDDPAASGNDRIGWTIRQDEATHQGLDTKFFLFLQFLAKAEYMGLPGRRSPQELGFDQPRGTLKMETGTGKVLLLTIGGAGLHGGVNVHNDFSATVYEVSRVVAEALLPKVDDLTVATQSSPWDQWMR